MRCLTVTDTRVALPRWLAHHRTLLCYNDDVKSVPVESSTLQLGSGHVLKFPAHTDLPLPFRRSSLPIGSSLLPIEFGFTGQLRLHHATLLLSEQLYLQQAQNLCCLPCRHGNIAPPT